MAPFLAGAFGNASSRDHSFGWDAAVAAMEMAGLLDSLPKREG
jgi:hypothetical protein